MSATLLVNCADRPGILAAVTTFITSLGGNVTNLDQYATEAHAGQYFMRLEFDHVDMDSALERFKGGFERIALDFGMDWRLSDSRVQQQVAVLVSKTDHTLNELLYQHAQGRLGGRITKIISNHRVLEPQAQAHGIDFHYIDMKALGKEEAELQIAKLCEQDDLIVLARYMQILSDEFAAPRFGRIINIHHSFLPAFIGADPYRQAFERGVKLIGATAHYVTAELDEGPIIEQGVTRVSHRYTPVELRTLGQDVERQVLARAVKWHLENRVIIHSNKTIVFS